MVESPKAKTAGTLSEAVAEFGVERRRKKSEEMRKEGIVMVMESMTYDVGD